MHSLPALTAEEAKRLHQYLAWQVAQMNGRKMEEDDFTSAYCAARGINERGWSNLDIDVRHGTQAIEHKMLKVKSGVDISTFCGTTQMHPSLTRSFRINPENDPDSEMKSVFAQYAENLESLRNSVAETSKVSATEVDLRIGWLLWQDSLREFLYFEQPLTIPDVSTMRAEWNTRDNKGRRKKSKSLWIYDKDGRKRFSCTTDAGQKIQPYFDVPPPNDPNLFRATVIGEHINDGTVRMWLTPETVELLSEQIGGLEDITCLINEIERVSTTLENNPLEDVPAEKLREMNPLNIPAPSYERLRSVFPSASSDENLMRAMINYIKASR